MSYSPKWLDGDALIAAAVEKNEPMTFHTC
jgi:hypothetical protein